MSLDLTGEPFPRDDRIRCVDCRELVLEKRHVIREDAMRAVARPGDCLAAIERRRTDVHDQYGPAHPDVPRRCEHFRPKPGADDQRPGTVRFPTLLAETAREAKRNGTDREAARRGIERAKATLDSS